MFKISNILQGFDYEFKFLDNPNIYNDSLGKLKPFSCEVLDKKLGHIAIKQFFNECMQDFSNHEDIFLNCFFHIRDRKDFVLPHILNTMFLSYAVCNWLELKEEDLLYAIMIAFFIDISLVRINNIVSKRRVFNRKEKEIVNHHSLYSAQIFNSIYPRKKEIVFFIENHQKYNFKKNKANNELKKVFKIVILSENFESFTHPKPYRKALNPNEAVNKLLKEFENIDKDTIKEFINYVGMYPVTSIVKLNTNEKGIVVSQNKGFPLRPKVRILYKDSPEKEKFINLLTEKDIFIEGIL